MEHKEFVSILSNIRIGTAVSTVAYCKEVHEKQLVSILEDIINNANAIREVVLLGDIFEFWAYPPSELPPTMKDIIADNPNILGENGMFCKMLSALNGRVIYLAGDHDINVTQSDLNHIISAEGYTLKYHAGAYIPTYDTRIKFIHGHEYTLINAPCFASKIAPLPIGYFVTRAIAYKVKSTMDKSPNNTSFNLKECGVCGLNEFLTMIPHFLMNHINDMDVIRAYIDVIADATGIPKNLKIRINKSISVSLNELENIYVNYYNNKEYIPSIVNINNLDCSTDTVIMGHTPMSSLICKNKKINYIHTGFIYQSDSNLMQEHIIYGIYNLSNRFISLMGARGDLPVSIQPYVNITPNRYMNHSNMSHVYKSSNKKDNNTFKSMDENEPSIENSIKANQAYINNLQQSKSIKSKDKSKAITSKLVLSENQVKPEKKLVFGWSVFDNTLEFWMIMQLGVLSKAKELDIDVIINNQKSSTEEMIKGSIDLINKGVDALLIAPYNPGAIPLITEQTKNNNIPVVVIDVGTYDAEIAAFIVSDNFGGGVLAGEYALKLIKKYSITSMNVAIIKTQIVATYALLRGHGFKNVMQGYGYHVVAEETANSRESEAYEVMKSILTSYANDLAVVFCENGTMAIGAAQAINEAGKKGIIMLIGFDATPAVMEEIKKGRIQGTIKQQPFRMGALGVEVANSILTGIPILFDDWTKKIILMEVFLVNENGETMGNII
ncbi:MAG: substrate-binding domain-containing protein [Lachnotalea sp.]